MRVVGFVVGFRVVGLEVPVVVGLRVVGLDVGLRVVGLAVVGMLVIGTSVPPPQTQHAIFAVTPACAKLFPYMEHLGTPSSLPAYHMQLYSTPSLS